jgi:RNA polymerase sigma-70 factor (ECF subfamily)
LIATNRPRRNQRVSVDQRALVERAQRGDHDAFTVLIERAAPRLDGAARLILRDGELARDVMQEAFFKAWRDLPGLREPDRFDAWLHRLTVHSCLDAARRRRRRPIEIDLIAIDGPSMSDHQSLFAAREMLDEALRRLDPEWRALIVLHYYLGLPMPEVAAALRIPLGTAKSRLNRSLGIMRDSIASGDADADADAATVAGGQFA